jgi:glycosyltransferase involved in cell wall biosynthesis
LKISIVTACRNAERLIGDTIGCVVGQTAVTRGRVELEYVIADGLSTDGTLDVARSLATSDVRIVSQRDRGLYDALARELPSLTGDWMAYLNAGDRYEPEAFDRLLDFVEAADHAWVTGRGVVIDENGTIVKDVLRRPFRRDLILAGQYCRRAPFFLPFIQQESTFWSTRLLSEVGIERLASFRVAGDYYLWTCFARTQELAVIDARLGSFRIHRGQLSENRTLYRDEVRSIARPLTASTAFEAAFEAVASLV